MQLSGAPTQIETPFAEAGSKNTIPQTTSTPGAASYTVGFPPVTMQPVSGGGIPPSGLDFNGLFNQGGSVIDQWISAGAGFPYNSAFQTAIGGYPKGSRVLRASSNGYWFSTADNNMTDPDTGGAGWVPDCAASSVYASAQQTLASGNSKVLWDTVEQDTLGLWDGTDKRFKAIWPGLYRLSGAVYLPAPAADNIGVMVYKNGALAKQCAQFPQVSNVPLSYPFDAVILCAAADYLEVFMNLSASTLTGQSGSNEAYVYGQIEFLGT